MAMSLEEHSCNEDALAPSHYQWEQSESKTNYGSVIPSSVTSSQERCSMYRIEDIHTAAPAPTITIAPSQSWPNVSAEEQHLQSKLREQRLRHKISEESLEHLVKVKELHRKLITPTEIAPEIRMLITQSPNLVSTSTRNVVGDSNLEMSISNASCPLEMELKKLQFQRLQQQGELEEAVHKVIKKLLTEAQN